MDINSGPRKSLDAALVILDRVDKVHCRELDHHSAEPVYKEAGASQAASSTSAII